jgi:endonuclease YncB( thermonuclease family)
MAQPIQILWAPVGVDLPSLGARALVDVSDGDTPNIRMPVRMLSVDTPEVTAGTPVRARAIDQEFLQLAEWIEQGRAPISRPLAEYLLPKLSTGTAGSLQFEQGNQASEFAKQNTQARLTRPDGTMRNLFIRVAETPFDDNGRLLAYVAPNYSNADRQLMSRRERATFNLDLVASGWAATFVIYPSIPGELDLPMLLEAASTASYEPRGFWTQPNTLLAYEYRTVEKLFRLTRRIVDGEPLGGAARLAWRERYCVDMRSRTLHGPENYFEVPPAYRLWLWPKHVGEAVARLNLIPSPSLSGTL